MTWIPGATLRLSQEGIVTVLFRSRDRAGNVEAAKSITLKIDKTPPSSAATLTPEANARGWHRSDVQVNLSATDQEPGSGIREIRYRIDDGVPVTVPGDSASFVMRDEGVHEVRYRAFDVAGNAEPKRSLTVRIDKTAPEMEAGSDPVTKGFVIRSLDTLSGPQTDPFTVTAAVYNDVHEKVTKSYLIVDIADNPHQVSKPRARPRQGA